MATKTYSPNEQLPASVAGPIQQSIAKISEGIKSLQGGSQGGAVVGGRIVGAGGQDLGGANTADVQGAGSPRLSPTQPIPSQPVPTQQLDPNAEAPQAMVDQASQLQNQVNTLASQKGLKLQQTPTGGYSAVPDLSAQYQQTKSVMDNAGLNLTSAGQGSAAVQAATKALTPQTESPSILGGLQETDSMFDSLFTQYDDFNSPQQQRTSLLDEYNKLSGSLGIDKLNQELVDTKRIIEGTEDDIRNEITAAGGTATASQVMALSNARNKQLIKNYNYLLDTKNAATTQLQTMMQLSIQDRTFAESEFDRKMGFATKVIEFKMRATENARSTYTSLISSGHADALLGDSYQNSLIEKTLGLSSGGLTKLAVEAKNKRLVDTVKTEVVDVGGRKYLINKQTGETIKEIGAGDVPTSLSTAQTQSDISNVQNLINDKNIRTAVGPTRLSRFIGAGWDRLTGGRQNFIAGVEQLRSQLTLDSLIQAKARGATFGALSEGELNVLSASASKLASWAKKDGNGNVVAYNASEKDFKAELEKINNFAKLDFILKGGDPTSVGVEVMPDGSYVVKNSDGTYTELQ